VIRAAGKVLVVDDEERIRRLLRMYLEKEGFQVEEASGGREGLEMALKEQYDLIVLDLLLPHMNGLTVCRHLRRKKLTPILMLTAIGDEAGKLEGFRAGADDYVVKPFSPREMIYRIKAIISRSNQQETWADSGKQAKSLLLPPLQIDHAGHRVLVHNQEIHLTLKEYELLHFLGINKGIAFTREELLKEIWGPGYICGGDYRTVDTHIKRIREKLGSISAEAGKLIRTIWGFGYCINGPIQE